MRADGRQELTAAASWRLSVAGSFVGIAAGGFVISLLSQLRQRTGWSVEACEPVAALCGALGVWCFSARHGVKEGCLAMAAAFLTMLLGDVFSMLSDSLKSEWHLVPTRLLSEQFGLTLRPRIHFDWYCWPKFLCYAFGVYIGWHLGSAGDATAPETPPEEGPE